MKKSKLLTVLNVLTEEEMDGFTRYLQAFYERQTIAQRVWAYLRAAHPFKEEAELDAQTVFVTVFPEEPTFKYRKLVDALSDLYLWLEEYLAWQFVKKNKEESDRCLAQVFKAKELKTFFKKKVLQWKERIVLKKAKDIWDYNQLIESNYLLYYHFTTDNLTIRKEYVQDLMHNLDQFFLAAKLKFGCELINRGNLYQEEHNIYLLEETLARIASDSNEMSPVHQAYEKIVRLLTNMDDEHYKELKLFLENNIHLLKAEENLQLLGTLTNYIAIKIRSGNIDANIEALKLYKYGLENKILHLNGNLSPVKLLNIVDLACRVGQYEWVEEFIIPELKSNSVQYNDSAIILVNAIIKFEQQEFDDAQQLLSQLGRYENDYYTIRARMLFLCVVFKTREENAFIDDNLEAFKQQLKRNIRLSTELLKSCLAFCDIFAKLNNPKWNKTRLKNRLDNQRSIAYKSWLLKKIELK